MEVERMYIFNGIKFLDYTKLPDFKERIKNELGLEDNSKDFISYYTNLVTSNGHLKTKINKIFFEHIIYGRLTNVYMHKIETTTSPPREFFLKRVEKIIDSFKPNISNPVQELMSVNGFYLMDLINVTKDGGTFMAGYDFTEKDGLIHNVRFLIGKTVYRKHIYKGKREEVRSEYLLGGVEINFDKGYVLILNKNTTNVQDADTEDKITSPSAFHNLSLRRIIEPLNITTKIKPKNDQEGMSIFCKFLFNSLIQDIREHVRDLTQEDINAFGVKATSLLKGSKKPITPSQTKEFKDKVMCLLLGIHIMNNYNEDEMSLKARDLDLVGFPTKISYKNSRSNKSSTGTTRANKSIANADTLYSLLTDFESTKYLDKWSMSWFANINDKSDIDLIQTTIEARQTYFKVTFGARRYLNEEIIRYVVEILNQYRNY